MTTIFAGNALTRDGWRQNVRVTLADGRITRLESGTVAQPGDERATILLPGMPNLHSHAFQRGMAGLAERPGASTDSFWTWREAMYRFALTMGPDDVEAVAAQLYVEMVEAGFTRVGEFHYLHHAPDGQPYDDIGELSARIGAAATESGIGLTLLPVFYAHASFGGVAPQPRQRRFICDLDSYARLLERAKSVAAGVPGGLVGVAPHSLRAVTPEELRAVAAMAGDGPVHIHIAEQMKEVEDCLAFCGRRPVELLFDSISVDERWCLIHATHMNDTEVRMSARSGAIAGLCPITEANLGDGTFRAAEFLGEGGRFGIGSDSNVLIGLGDELRQLEYSQRLRDQQRNVLAAGGVSTGRRLFEAALEGGSQALGAGPGGIAEGGRADLVTLDGDHPGLVGRDGDEILDSWVFAGPRAVESVWVGGARLVAGGRHIRRAAVASRFARTMRRLRETSAHATGA